MKSNSNFRGGGGSRTRTYEGVSQRIYSPPPLPLGTFPQTRHPQLWSRLEWTLRTPTAPARKTPDRLQGKDRLEFGGRLIVAPPSRRNDRRPGPFRPAKTGYSPRRIE